MSFEFSDDMCARERWLVSNLSDLPLAARLCRVARGGFLSQRGMNG